MQTQDIQLIDKNLSPDGKVAVLTYQCQSFSFEEGQFVMLQREIEGKIVKRAYSIASTDRDADRGQIVFVVKETENPLFSHYLVTDSKQGDVVTMFGPLGHMTWKDQHTNALLISVGSGRWPMRWLTYELLRLMDDKQQWRVVHVFGERTGAQIPPLMQADFDQRWHHPRYQWKYMLSRETEPSVWRQQGYVQDALEEVKELVGHDVQIFLCGHPAMVDDVRDCLINDGYSKEQIVFEKY